MKERDLLDDELNSLSPLLRDQKRKSDGFQAPPDYFDRMEAEVLRKTTGNTAGRNAARSIAPPLHAHTRSLWIRRVAMAAAATVALILTAWWLFQPKTDAEQAETMAVSAETPSGEEIEAYVLENLQDFETEQLAVLQHAGEAEAAVQNPVERQPGKQPKSEIKPEDLDRLLNDMSDEELEEIL